MRYVSIIVTAALIYVIILLVRVITKKSDKEENLLTGKIVAFFTVLSLLACAGQEVFDNSYASVTAKAIVLIALFAWFFWSVMVARPAIEEQREKERAMRERLNAQANKSDSLDNQ